MERKIKFRGKRKSDGLWLQGSLINNLFGHPIFGQMEHVITDINEYEYDCYQDLDNCDIEVLPETVGQFTGLYDKNGKEIWEGDIVNYAVKKKLCECMKETDLFLGTTNFCPDCGKKVEDKDFVKSAEIRFMEGGFVLYSEDKKGEYYQAWQTYIAEIYIEWKEVIGNVYENEELKAEFLW